MTSATISTMRTASAPHTNSGINIWLTSFHRNRTGYFPLIHCSPIHFESAAGNSFIKVCKLSSFHFPISLVVSILPPGSGVGAPFPGRHKDQNKLYLAYPIAPAMQSTTIRARINPRTSATMPATNQHRNLSLSKSMGSLFLRLLRMISLISGFMPLHLPSSLLCPSVSHPSHHKSTPEKLQYKLEDVSFPTQLIPI